MGNLPLSIFIAASIFSGLMFVTSAVAKVAAQLKRQNELKEAELRAAGVAF